MHFRMKYAFLNRLRSQSPAARLSQTKAASAAHIRDGECRHPEAHAREEDRSRGDVEPVIFHLNVIIDTESKSKKEHQRPDLIELRFKH